MVNFFDDFRKTDKIHQNYLLYGIFKLYRTSFFVHMFMELHCSSFCSFNDSFIKHVCLSVFLAKNYSEIVFSYMWRWTYCISFQWVGGYVGITYFIAFIFALIGWISFLFGVYSFMWLLSTVNGAKLKNILVMIG